MRFDNVWMDDDKAEGGNLPLAPEGTHTGEIISAKEKRLQFMQSDKNPDGLALVVVIDIPRYQQVECITPANYRGKLEAIARAAGIPLPSRDGDWDEKQLEGRTVTVQTLQAVSKKGTQYVRVEKWLPSPSQLQSKSAPPARSQAAKAHKAFTANAASDDIPF